MSSKSTVYTVDNVELRVGYYNRKQYGWGRFTIYSPGETLYFEISEDGGKTAANWAEA
jgi:hypothetical protein